jgi:hypothetical protein
MAHSTSHVFASPRVRATACFIASLLFPGVVVCLLLAPSVGSGRWVLGFLCARYSLHALIILATGMPPRSAFEFAADLARGQFKTKEREA